MWWLCLVFVIWLPAIQIVTVFQQKPLVDINLKYVLRLKDLDHIKHTCHKCNVCYCLHFQLPNACDVDLNHVVGNVTSGSSAVTGNVLTDRPHTISSAYEKGHLRPSLQPYTFSPPESTLTIQESDGEQATVGQRQPPPPRYIFCC